MDVEVDELEGDVGKPGTTTGTTISAVKPRPPAPDDRIFLLYFLYKAAELKRFRSHPLKCTRCLYNAGWVGGL